MYNIYLTYYYMKIYMVFMQLLDFLGIFLDIHTIFFHICIVFLKKKIKLN